MKLEKRRQALKTVFFSEGDKRRAEEILHSPNAVEFMSLEESDQESEYNGRGPRPRKTRKLKWERSKLRNIKKTLDEHHKENLSKQQQRTSAVVQRSDDVSGRPAPKNSPGWAVRPPQGTYATCTG